MALLALPYLQGYSQADGRRDVTVYDTGRADDGLNLYISGHAPEAFLTDMTGRTLHRWRLEFQQAWPGRIVERENRGQERFWRNVQLLDNGDLLAIFERLGVVRIDKNSRLLWAYGGGCHHDVSMAPDGFVYVLTRRPMQSGGAFEDFVTILDGEGHVRREVSLLRCFQDSDYRGLLDLIPEGTELFHTNRLQILSPEMAPQWPGGPLALISVPTLNVIALVDLARERVVWVLAGMWRSQHDPTFLGSGRILVFDNGWDPIRKLSRVVEIDPATQRILWEYSGDQERPLYSQVCGSSQRLRNGNTLVVESTQGRALEVTLDKQIVWEFVNPFRDPVDGRRVATLYGLKRLPAELPSFVSR